MVVVTFVQLSVEAFARARIAGNLCVVRLPNQSDAARWVALTLCKYLLTRHGTDRPFFVFHCVISGFGALEHP